MNEQKTTHKSSFVPMFRDIVALVAQRFGAAQLGALCVLAARADFAQNWAVKGTLREWAAACNMSVNTLKNKVLVPFERAGLIAVESQDRVQTQVFLRVFEEMEKTGSVSRFDTAQKNKPVSNFDTETDSWAAVFPQFMVKSVSNFDTAQSVSNFDTATPLHTTPHVVVNNINNNINTQTPNKKNNFLPTLAEVKAFFAAKNFVADPEDFFHKNEARNWIWVDKAGKQHKIKNWKSCAYEWNKRAKAAGKTNWENPAKLEEQLFKWYYEQILPELFGNETARNTRWAQERGSFAFIACVAKDLQRGQEIILQATESLERSRLTPSIKAVANMAITLAEKMGS
ncbi:MAG: hypothetical protein IKJ44_03315 [Elusimicrobiaceae bacterium]|nr:hypothetical protein [Elusimicrobiaceae bacterium]